MAVTINASRNFASRVARSLRLFFLFLFSAPREEKPERRGSLLRFLGNVVSPPARLAFNSRLMDIAVNALKIETNFFFFVSFFLSFFPFNEEFRCRTVWQ